MAHYDDATEWAYGSRNEFRVLFGSPYRFWWRRRAKSGQMNGDCVETRKDAIKIVPAAAPPVQRDNGRWQIARAFRENCAVC